MMFHLPYIGMPYYNKYSRYGYRYPYYAYKPASSFYTMQNKAERKNNGNTSKYSSILSKDCDTSTNRNSNTSQNKKNTPNNSEKHSNYNPDPPLFQLFGLNLYFDDILLICLIWFLYDEGVKDESLFIALILLLLS